MKCLCAATRRAARLLTKAYEVHLRESGLTAAQFELLAELYGRGPASQTELAEALAVDQTTLSRGLRLLVTQRWLARATDTADRRIGRYALTPKGLQKLNDAMPHWRAAQEAARLGLGTDWDTAWQTLERLGVRPAV